ncbi:hypothetical protein FYK55_10265 [Roseiconus nitratireducens]|uniref:Uncharacterized protein n=1 Tax=Roseiconus nitratireducens TaxID=2605748 RepID=A0A5M6D7P7_9BACT|nr:hypothetical protein [Roseiconus nitratireducens]KAA5543588.1 hypothetical protein FYK55_10265 [Roseiconus nitratireducens]
MVKPVLQAMVLADHVYQDRQSGKHIIAGTFTQIQLRQPPKVTEEVQEDGEKRKRFSGPIGGMGSPYLYLAFTGLRNSQQFCLQLVDLSDAKVLMEYPFKLEFEDPVAIAEVSLGMPHLQLAMPRKSGSYSLDLIWSDEQIGSWRIEAVADPVEHSGEKNDS